MARTCTNTTVLKICNISGIEALLQTAQLRWCGHVIRMDNTQIPKQVFYGQLHHGFQRPGGQYKRYKDCLKSTMTQCGITPSELETLAMDRTGWRSTCKSAVEEFEVAFRSWRPNGICANLVHHPPATSSARSATRCVAHGLGFLPTTSHTRVDETRRIDGSVHDTWYRLFFLNVLWYEKWPKIANKTANIKVIRCSAIAERPRCRVHYSFRQK